MDAKGFTLVELMVTLAISAIVLTVGVASFANWPWIIGVRFKSMRLLSTLGLARAEAIYRNTRVVVCKSADGAGCATTGGWEQGWMVFADANDNGAFDAGETLLRIYGGLDEGSTLRGNSNVANYVSYLGSGYSRLISGGFQAGTLILCDSHGFGANARAIIINAAGRVRTVAATEQDSVATCTPG